MIEAIYVFYAGYTGYPEFIREMDEAKYQQFKGWQPDDPRLHAATIYSDSTREDDPILTIVAVTEYNPLGREYAEAINQIVIDWLMDSGRIAKR